MLTWINNHCVCQVHSLNGWCWGNIIKTENLSTNDTTSECFLSYICTSVYQKRVFAWHPLQIWGALSVQATWRVDLGSWPLKQNFVLQKFVLWELHSMLSTFHTASCLFHLSSAGLYILKQLPSALTCSLCLQVPAVLSGCLPIPRPLCLWLLHWVASQSRHHPLHTGNKSRKLTPGKNNPTCKYAKSRLNHRNKLNPIQQ